jgi:hypothetical protein
MEANGVSRLSFLNLGGCHWEEDLEAGVAGF